jgi:hypothetical protein
MKKHLVKILIAAVVCLIAVVVVLTLSLGSIVKKGVERVGPQITRTDMKLDGAIISVFSGSGTLKGFLLGNPEGYKTASAIKVGEVNVGVKPGSVLSDKIHVTHVRMKAPEITFEGTLGKQNNLGQILENVEAVSASVDQGKQPADKKKDKGAATKLQVDDFLIEGARVNASLTMLGGRSVTVAIPDIHFTDLGTGPEGITAAELTKKVLSQVTAETLKAVEKIAADVGKQAGEILRDATKGDTNSLDKAAKGIGDFFKKK